MWYYLVTHQLYMYLALHLLNGFLGCPALIIFIAIDIYSDN